MGEAKAGDEDGLHSATRPLWLYRLVEGIPGSVWGSRRCQRCPISATLAVALQPPPAGPACSVLTAAVPPRDELCSWCSDSDQPLPSRLLNCQFLHSEL